MTVSQIENLWNDQKLCDNIAISDTSSTATTWTLQENFGPFPCNNISVAATLAIHFSASEHISRLPTMALKVPDPSQSLDALLLAFNPTQGHDAAHAFNVARRLPPVTKSSLEPLSVDGFYNLPGLRYLINFDMEAHVGPAHDIVYMAKNPHKAWDMNARDGLYWSAIQYELEARAYLAKPELKALKCIPSGVQSVFENKSRLRRMFKEIQDLVALVVSGEQEVRSVLDPEIRMQEVSEGRMPSAQMLATWFRVKLLAQCAIKRDDMVNRLCDDMHGLEDSNDAQAVCLVLQGLFNVLHVLKLDIANHQIKANRARIMTENSMFFQTHYQKQILQGDLDPSPSVTWFDSPNSSLHPVVHFVWKSVSSLFQCVPGRSAQEVFPGAWEYDFGGLNSILGDLETLIAVEICLRRLPSILTSLGHSDRIERVTRLVRVTLPTVVGDSSWQSAAGNIAIEILQAADEKHPRMGLMSAEKEPSSIGSASYGIPSASLASGIAPTTSRATPSGRAYASVTSPKSVEIDAETRPDRSISSSMLPLLDLVEHNLFQDLDPQGPVFQEQLIATQESLSAKLSTAMWQSYKLKPWQLSNMFVGPTQDPRLEDNRHSFAARSYAHERGPQLGSPTMDDIVNRLTHVLVLHWQWAGPLIYAVGRSGIFDPIREPRWDVMAGFQQGLDRVPLVKALVYEELGAEKILEESGWAQQVIVGGAQDNEWWDHRYGTTGVLRRRFAHSTDQDEDSNSVGEHASSSGGNRPAAR